TDKVFQLKYGKEDVFWYETYTSKGGKDYSLSEPELRNYLRKQGFRNFEGEPVHITGNILKRVNPEYIFKHTLKYIESFKEPGLEGMFLKKGETLLLKNKAIIISLPECELQPLRDTRERSYKYYRNGIVVIAPGKEFKVIPYEEAKGL